MPVSLRAKLAAIDKPKPAKEHRPPSSGECLVIEHAFPLETLPHRDSLEKDILDHFMHDAPPAAFDYRRALYIDTETTGLSRGSGTVAFLVGVGYFTDEAFIIKQFLMRDYPEEPSLLSKLLELLENFDLFVSFNGRAFDIPLLQARLIMNRFPPSSLSLPHADALYPARRIWKLRLQNCSLSHLEEEILGVKRENDLPGALVPERYFRYLKSGAFSLLEDILEHNRQDILSLCRLFHRLYDIHSSPEQQSFLEDIFSAGRALEKKGNVEGARRCYRLSAKGHLSAPAHSLLGQSYRRMQQVDEAIATYTLMAERGEGGPVPFIELAKLYEHRVKDISAALLYTEKAIAKAAEPSLFQSASLQDTQNALQYRYMRLLRKQQRTV